MNDHVEKWQNNLTKQMIFILNEKIDACLESLASMTCF